MMVLQKEDEEQEDKRKKNDMKRMTKTDQTQNKEENEIFTSAIRFHVSGPPFFLVYGPSDRTVLRSERR